MLSELSFKEKSICLSLIVTVTFPLYFFFSIGPLDTISTELIKGLFIKLASIYVIGIIIIHIVVAALDHKEAQQAEDERDKIVSLYAYKNSYCILVVSLLLVLFGVFSGYPLEQFILFSNASVFVNLSLYAWIVISIADTCKYATKLYLYRRGF